jgi:hypothetical protein
MGEEAQMPVKRIRESMSILQNIEKQQKHDKHIISPNAIHKEQ